MFSKQPPLPYTTTATAAAAAPPSPTPIYNHAVALKHSQLPERYQCGILNEWTPSLIKKGNISWNKPPFVSSANQADSQQALSSKAERGDRRERKGKKRDRGGGGTPKFVESKEEI